MQGLMVFMLVASLMSCYNVPIVEEEEQKEMVDKDQISAVRVSDVDVETKM